MINLYIKFCECCIKLIEFVLYKVLGVFHIECEEKNKSIVRQFMKFAFVGVSNVIITLLIYYAIIFYDKNLYILGNTIGYVAGIVNSYNLNSRWVFTSHKNKKQEVFIKMCICYLGTYLLQTIILYVFIDQMHISQFIAPIISIIITTPVNFVLNKLWTYKENK